MADYHSVPNPGRGVPEADMGIRRPQSADSFSASPEVPNDGYLGTQGLANPAPSIMSRDSTYGSLNAPSINSGSGHQARSSWGSNNMLAAGEAGMAGSDVSVPTEPMALAWLARSKISYGSRGQKR